MNPECDRAFEGSGRERFFRPSLFLPSCHLPYQAPELTHTTKDVADLLLPPSLHLSRPVAYHLRDSEALPVVDRGGVKWRILLFHSTPPPRPFTVLSRGPSRESPLCSPRPSCSQGFVQFQALGTQVFPGSDGLAPSLDHLVRELLTPSGGSGTRVHGPRHRRSGQCQSRCPELFLELRWKQISKLGSGWVWLGLPEPTGARGQVNS